MKTPFSLLINKMIVANLASNRSNWATGRYLSLTRHYRATGWSLGSIIEAQDVLSPISTLQIELDNVARYLVVTRILPISVLVLVWSAVLGLFLTNRLVAPILKLAAEAQRSVKVNGRQYPCNQHDEVGVLAHAFAVMASKSIASSVNWKSASRNALATWNAQYAASGSC